MNRHLVFIGDSLTQWFNWQRRFPGDDVDNLGIAGETVEGLLGRRDRIRAQVREPDFIFLMTGINDLASGQEEISGPYREIVRNLTTWYRTARIVVQSILPVDLVWMTNDAVRTANRHLARIAQEYGAEFLDVYIRFVDAKGKVKSGLLSDDGVHLGTGGYTVWADEVEGFLKAARAGS